MCDEQIFYTLLIPLNTTKSLQQNIIKYIVKLKKMSIFKPSLFSSINMSKHINSDGVGKGIYLKD